MKTVNFDSIKEHVSTQYGDFTGVIQIDGHSNITSIYELCEDYKFDTKDKFIIGFSLGESTIRGIGYSNQVKCTILYVDTTVYGESFEEVERNIKSDGILKLNKKEIEIEYSKIGKYIKRYSLIVTTELTNYATKIEINEDEN